MLSSCSVPLAGELFPSLSRPFVFGAFPSVGVLGLCSFSCRLPLLVCPGLRWFLGVLRLCLFSCRLLLFVSRGSGGGVLRAGCWVVVCRLFVGVWPPWVLHAPCLSACLACLSSSSSSFSPFSLACLPFCPLSPMAGGAARYGRCVPPPRATDTFFPFKGLDFNPTSLRPAGPPGRWRLGTCSCGCRRGKSVVRGNPSLRPTLERTLGFCCRPNMTRSHAQS